MATIYRPKGRKTYIIEWFDENNKRHRKSGTSDKSVAKRIAADIENKKALRKEGLIDRAAERFAECDRQSISGHLDDFIASLEANKRDPKHVRTTRTYIQRIIDKSRAVRLTDLTLSAVELAVGAIQKEGASKKRNQEGATKKGKGLSARAANAHLTAVKAFLRWATKDNRIRTHELGSIDRRNEEADRRYVRRPLTEEELRTLISTTRTAPEWRGIGGVDRSVFYLIGAATGFRRSEMGELCPEDFDLSGPRPVVRLDGSRTKNGKSAEQPLLLSLAVELQAWLAEKAPRSPVFALPEKTAQMLHADLRRCGIEPVDAQKRVVDTHSLRHGYISALARAGVPLKVAQTLARHSDPKLTMNIYAHLSVHDLHGAVTDALPDLTTPRAADALVATGTDAITSNSLCQADSRGSKCPTNHPTLGGEPRGTPIFQGPQENRTLTLNQRVVGSSPTGGTLNLNRERT